MNPDLVILLVSFPFGILTIMALLRFLMQLSRVDPHNRIASGIRRITDIYCGPLRKLLPETSPYDWASLVMAVLLQALSIYLVYFVFAAAVQTPSIANLLAWAIFAVIGLALRAYFIFLIFSVVFSWVNPSGTDSIAQLCNQMIAPLLKPFHKLIPPMGGLDFSPMALFFLIYLLQTVWRALVGSIGLPLGAVLGV